MNKDEHGIQRRVAGTHEIRLDGIQDLYTRAAGSSVFDIGCNRGAVALDMMKNGATVLHGCDNYVKGIETARELFADYRHVRSQFEVVDLAIGPDALKPFSDNSYDIVLMLATYHKLKRIMTPEQLAALMQSFGRRTKHFFGWRGTSDKPQENEQEMLLLDRELGAVGLSRIHTSYISVQLGAAAIWARL